MLSAEAAAACSTLDKLLCSLAHTVLLCAGYRQGVPPSLLHLLSPAHFAQPLPSTTFSLPPTGIRALHLPGKPRLALIGPPVTAASAPAVLGLQAVVPLNSAVWVQVQQEEVLLRGQDSVKRVGTAHVRGSGKEPKAGTGASIDWEALSASCSSPPGAPSNCACSKRRAAHRVVSNGRQGERWEGVQALPGDPLQRRQAGQRERGQQTLARPQPKGRPTRACCRAPLGRTWQVKRRGPGWARRWGCAAPAARTLWKCPVSSSFTLLCRSSTARRSGGAPGRSTSPSTEVASGKWVWRGGGGGAGRGWGGSQWGRSRPVPSLLLERQKAAPAQVFQQATRALAHAALHESFRCSLQTQASGEFQRLPASSTLGSKLRPQAVAAHQDQRRLALCQLLVQPSQLVLPV